MREFVWKTLNSEQRREALKRPAIFFHGFLRNRVTEILSTVKKDGDKALLDFTEQFDRVKLSTFAVTPQEIASAQEKLDAKVAASIWRAAENIKKFHEIQSPPNLLVDVIPGLRCERKATPIDPIGLYIPGGSAPLFSTVLMLGIPSLIAGCTNRVLCSPPSQDGTLNPYILFAAELCGIKKIFKVGGAQAIAAMAYGTESVPKVEKVFGPGNSWVTEAKLQASLDPEGAAQDFPAGPSEVLVIADDTANPRFVASDLLSQAEHGTDSQVILVTTSQTLADEVKGHLEDLLSALPRKKIANEALEKSAFIYVESLSQALEVSNSYAPEHLILQVVNPRALAEGVKNAGSVFIGPWTPESMGDYASGTNHVLPTYGFARAYSGVSVESFQKKITFQELTSRALQDLGPTVESMAEAEGLLAHKNAVSVRLQALEALNG